MRHWDRVRFMRAGEFVLQRLPGWSRANSVQEIVSPRGIGWAMMFSTGTPRTSA